MLKLLYAQNLPAFLNWGPGTRGPGRPAALDFLFIVSLELWTQLIYS